MTSVSQRRRPASEHADASIPTTVVRWVEHARQHGPGARRRLATQWRPGAAAAMTHHHDGSRLLVALVIEHA